MNQAAIARAAEMSATTLGYYVKQCKRPYIPVDKPWSKALRAELVARGCTAAEAADLFGLQETQDIRDVQNSVNELRKDVKDLRNELHNDRTEIKAALEIINEKLAPEL